MVNKRWNINALLCRKADSKISNIEDIFDKLIVNENGYADFTIVTIMNSIEADEEKFALYYFIEHVTDDDKIKILYLCNSKFHKISENEKSGFSTVQGYSHKITRIQIEECEFPYEGSYELKVYKYDNDDYDDTNTEDEKHRYFDEEHLVSIYPFEVKKTNKK